MAIDPNTTRAAQSGKTVTTSDGYQIVYDDNGFGRKSIAPDGSVKYYDSLGNQTKTPWEGPTPTNQPSTGVVDTAGIAAAAKAQGGVESDPATEAAIARIEANRSAPNPQQTPQEAVAAVVEAEKANQQKQVPVEQSLSTGEEIVQPEKTVDPKEDPFEQARLDAEKAADAEGPTEQAVIDAKQDTKLSQEEEGQLREFQENQRALLKEQSNKAGNPEGNWTAGSVNQVRQQQTIAVSRNTIQKDDWRVRLSLAPSAKYLYNIATQGDILYPLKDTDGVIFPYTPQVQTAYRANYDSADITHSNYKMYFYKNSNVDEITITADFTAQDNAEANYMLAVIHFFRSVTKMFYGQDGNNGPKAGTPPPLCYLNGFGQYQFNEHPVLVSSFTYTLPNDVDYIRAGSPTTVAGTPSTANKTTPPSNKGGGLMSWLRTTANNLKTKQTGKGASSKEAAWKNYANKNVTYVPTKIQFQISLLPIVTRNDISKNFSLEKYATGSLLKGRDRPTGGGIW